MLGALVTAGLTLAGAASATLPGCEVLRPGAMSTYDQLTVCALDERHTQTPYYSSDFYRPAGVTYFGYQGAEYAYVDATTYQGQSTVCFPWNCNGNPTTGSITYANAAVYHRDSAGRTTAAGLNVREGGSSNANGQSSYLTAAAHANAAGSFRSVEYRQVDGANGCTEWAMLWQNGQQTMLLPMQPCTVVAPGVPYLPELLPAL